MERASKSGFTLIELLVYMAIMSFVIIVAGRVFSDSTTMRVRSQNMLKSSEEVGRVSNLIKEDMSQMGVKAWGHSTSSNDYTVRNIGTTLQDIYLDKTNGDVSSYALKHRKQSNNTFRDSIAFRKAAFDNNGLFLGIREIIWELRNDSLFRKCATIKSECPSNSANVCGSFSTDKDRTICPERTSANNAEPVLIAKNIMNFKIIPSAPGMDNSNDILFAEPDFKLISRPANSSTGVKLLEEGKEKDIYNETNPVNNETVTTVRNFAQTSTENKHNELYLTNKDGQCPSSLTFKKGETYSIEFKMPYSIPTGADAKQLQEALSSTQFVPTRDHLAIGLRKKSDWSVPEGAPKDILFYPAQSELASDLTRHLEFSVSKEEVKDVCVVIIVAYYPPETADKFNSAKGLLKFSNFKIFRNADKTFRFLKNGETGYHEDYGTEARTPLATRIKEKTNAKAFELTLEIENKGEKSGTYSSEGKGMVIITPNNGVIPKEAL